MRQTAIHYDEKSQLFHLSTRNTSYVLQIVRDGYVAHRYWGKRVNKFRDSRPIVFMGRPLSPNPDEDWNFSPNMLPWSTQVMEPARVYSTKGWAGCPGYTTDSIVPACAEESIGIRKDLSLSTTGKVPTLTSRRRRSSRSQPKGMSLASNCWYYFTHPGRVNGHHEDSNNYETRRSSIQVAKLEVVDGVLICNRDKEFELNLGAED